MEEGIKFLGKIMFLKKGGVFFSKQFFFYWNMFFISLFVIVFGGGKFWIIEFDFFFFVYQNIKYIFVDIFIINFILFVCLMYGFIEVLQNIEFEGILIDFVLNIFWVVFK